MTAVLLFSCSSPERTDRFKWQIENGQFTMLEKEIDSLKVTSDQAYNPEYLDSLQEIIYRVRYDFSLNEQQVKEQLGQYFDNPDDSVIVRWERSGRLEMRYIDGEKRYFKNAVGNLCRFIAFDLAKESDKASSFSAKNDSLGAFCLRHTARVIVASRGFSNPVEVQNMEITYWLTVKPNAVPGGKMIRCWLPAPREGSVRQTGFKRLKSDPENSVLSPGNYLQRTFYMEKKAVKDRPTRFLVQFSLQTKAQYFNLNPEDIKPYDENSAIYRDYTKERAPHLVFFSRD